jgi:transposase
MQDCSTLTVDYHDENCVIRYRRGAAGKEEVLTVPTTRAALNGVVERALAESNGRLVVWIQESTTGWARVQALLGERVEFVLANVIQMPLPPKGRRRKTDKIDTARLQREYLNGSLPRAATPEAWWRRVRRLVAAREDLVRRRTSLRNWINRYFAHETWEDRSKFWSVRGRKSLAKLVESMPDWDRQVIGYKQAELDLIEKHLAGLEAEFERVHAGWLEARRIDAVKGISVVAAVSIAARIGPIKRFKDAEALIGYAGLAPGVQQSDQTCRHGRIGGAGTDKQLRHYLIEASVWARRLERYREAYERASKRRGKKIGRLVVARMLLRSIFKVLRDGVDFDESLGKKHRPERVATK